MSPTAYKNSYGAYSRANHTVPKTRQVVMLYDGIIRSLQQAREATRDNKIEERFNKLIRAQKIITGLQMSLDFEGGAEAAQVLYDFYSHLDSRIMKLHRGAAPEEYDEIVDEVKHMREMWNNIDQEFSASMSEAQASQVTAASDSAGGTSGDPSDTALGISA